MKLSTRDTSAAMKAAHKLAKRLRHAFSSYAQAFRACLIQCYNLIRRRAARAIQDVKACRVLPGNILQFGKARVVVDDVDYHADVVRMYWTHKGASVMQCFKPHEIVYVV